VAQLVAHLHGMQGVRGSSPLRSTVEGLPQSTSSSKRVSRFPSANALEPPLGVALVVGPERYSSSTIAFVRPPSIRDLS
jgi:hypothetical protein